MGNAVCSCLATSAVLSGLASSTMMISYSKPLYSVRYYDLTRCWDRSHIILLREALVEQPDNNGQVLPLVVGRQNDGILVSRSH